ncbi:MAG: viperin family antiviral radical SAM protein [Pasteurellaceae bacterium]|nr:viperin family antiviral radical SAM protein [Pasteurellaceae bacterium]
MTNSNTHELVVNWHLTEHCNFSCAYCFAKWDKEKPKELIHDMDKCKKLLEQIKLLPKIINESYNTNFNKIRLNLVGGEPFIYKKKIKEIVLFARELGFSISAITNGSKFDYELEEFIAKNFSMLGISIDSLDNDCNRNIGRVNNIKIPLDIDCIKDSINNIRRINPNINIKLNTVVSSENYLEDFTCFIKSIHPSKWKVLKVLGVVTNKFNIDDEKFRMFLNNHKELSSIISYENNELMIESYIMIDPLGRFFQNKLGNYGYSYSNSIIETGINSSFKQISFDLNQFELRYKHRIL